MGFYKTGKKVYDIQALVGGKGLWLYGGAEKVAVSG